MWFHGTWNCFPYFWILPLVFFLIILFFISRSGRSPLCGSNEHVKEESAREILNRRYAKGEIGKEEFEQMKKDIQS